MKTLGGTAALPGFTFIADPDTGLWRPGTDRLGVATAGTARWEWDASGHYIPATDAAVNIGDATHNILNLFMAGALNMDATSWTPALTAATTNPTLGTGSSVEGYYWDLGTWAVGFAAIRFGTAGTNAGSGNYRYSLPVNVDTTFYDNVAAQIGWISCVSAGNGRQGILRRQTTNTANSQFMTDAADASPNTYQQFSDTRPGAWTANDRIYYSFIAKKA